MNLTTERCLIRPFTEDDWQDVYVYTSNAAVMKYIPEGVFSKEDSKKFVKHHSGESAKHFAVVLKEGDILVGHMAFHQYFGDHTYEIGWVFNPKYQNKGYASEAAYSLLNHGFKTMNLHRIIATCQPENIPSWRVMEKLGMRREGYFKKCIPQGNEWWDEFYYAILQEEWLVKKG
ncbi:GNAT family N-acetyltransferase [Bacillus sp. LLTC93]|uniref:GNAT family N-acetyltransferase n=1 Tax=Bacillus sp. LLTC93 TaxID=2108274 RepID=UPI000D01E9F7|nr:GNAT family protein [Bacillus sp. LLTC93]PRO39647.1 GNAT family N-acetyltransferase [Bacillus sp. LLTC93]